MMLDWDELDGEGLDCVVVLALVGVELDWVELLTPVMVELDWVKLDWEELLVLVAMVELD